MHHANAVVYGDQCESERAFPRAKNVHGALTRRASERASAPISIARFIYRCVIDPIRSRSIVVDENPFRSFRSVRRDPSSSRPVLPLLTRARILPLSRGIGMK